jgi:threonine synthase
MWRFRESFSLSQDVPPVSLGEGGTPLLRSRQFSQVQFWWKDETRNPTGSHKDRALSLAATHALSVGATTMVVASAGSTGLSAAAYAARAGLRSVTLVPREAPQYRTYPPTRFGSHVIEVGASLDAALEALRVSAGRVPGLYVASTSLTSNPIQAEAARTIAYEIVEELARPPTCVIVPTGGGGTLASVWQGFKDLLARGSISQLPKMVAVVPAAYDALRRALADRVTEPAEFARLPYSDELPATVLAKLAHAHPPDGPAALAALIESGGTVVAVADGPALDAVRTIGANDGLYLEPSSSVVVPALDELIAHGFIGSGDLVVALACGSGFRETPIVSLTRPVIFQQIDIDHLTAGLAALAAR